MYRPKFCCECGERVLRARWGAWTSRRFCRACAPRLRRVRLLRPIAFASALACACFALGRASKPSAPAAVFERGALDLTRLPPPSSPARAKEPRQGGEPSPRSEPSYGPDGTAGERPTDPAEVVYVCGARTKKGTPCQRRVRGPGRCWQHRGRPAILPPSKLVVEG